VQSIKRLFWVLLAVFVFIGCAPPIGYISGGNGTGNEELWALAYRVVYDLNNLFRRNSDVAVFTSYRGALQPISIKDVKISVIEDPSSPDILIEVPVDEDYPLDKPGRKIIVLEYKGLEARYSIEVQDPLGLTDPNGEGNIGMGNGGIIWVY
jgi:hypothetical protein